MTFLNLREFNDVFVFDISAGIENNKFDNLQYTKQNLNSIIRRYNESIVVRQVIENRVRYY